MEAELVEPSKEEVVLKADWVTDPENLNFHLKTVLPFAATSFEERFWSHELELAVVVPLLSVEVPELV